MRAESVTSGKSRTSTRDRYRVKSKTSDVDETLFASPTKRKAHAPPKKETVQVSTVTPTLKVGVQKIDILDAIISNL